MVEEGLIEAAGRELIAPPKTANVFSLPAEQLKAINGPRVRGRIAAGERDEERLLAELGTWPGEWPADVPVRLSFLGINLSFACNMEPRCVYCNQRPVAERMGMEDWKRLVCGAVPEEEEGPYVFITGGEPLLFGEELWGRDGLIRAATQAGAACNVNTNGLALTPRAALGLVSSGVARVHLSLDTRCAPVQDAIHRKAGRWGQVVRGLENLQVAKAVLGAGHPVIHVNCVLTRLNAWDFPGFLAFLVGMKPLVEGASSPDLDLHVIPVGGEENRALRLSAEEYRRFFTETWEAADAVWRAYQEERGVPEDKRGALHEKLPFLSPYHRVAQRGGLVEWAERAGAGLPAALALTQRCYVGPTQAFVLPDGAQYWCGGHATSRPEPVGSVLGQGVGETIRQGIGQMARLPSEYCRTCAGATQAINQSVEAALRHTIGEWLSPGEGGGESPTQDERAFE